MSETPGRWESISVTVATQEAQDMPPTERVTCCGASAGSESGSDWACMGRHSEGGGGPAFMCPSRKCLSHRAQMPHSSGWLCLLSAMRPSRVDQPVLTRSSSRSSVTSHSDLPAHDTRPPLVLGICAMDIKARSKPMREILTRLVQWSHGAIQVKVFGDKVILDEGMSLPSPYLPLTPFQMSKTGLAATSSSPSFPPTSPSTRPSLTSSSTGPFA